MEQTKDKGNMIEREKKSTRWIYLVVGIMLILAISFSMGNYFTHRSMREENDKIKQILGSSMGSSSVDNTAIANRIANIEQELSKLRTQNPSIDNQELNLIEQELNEISKSLNLKANSYAVDSRLDKIRQEIHDIDVRPIININPMY